MKSGYRGLIYRLVKRLAVALKESIGAFYDLWRSTYSHTDQSLYLTPLIINNAFKNITASELIPKEILFHYLNHRFDLLGSGWVHVYHGIDCRGMSGHWFPKSADVKADHTGHWLKERLNRSNLAESIKIWSLVGHDYRPIDWQLDFKSGYRWSEKYLSKKIRYGYLPGADVKVPWELARMNHLPQMSLVYMALPKQAKERQCIVEEFRNQILDFIATNPPRYGVNWCCSMDVAIRAANWVLAYSIFRAGGVVFDSDFNSIFARSVYEHGKHIVTNLEWHYQNRGNHYLSDIVGLVFISASLPRTNETDAWLALGVQELIEEVKYQFYPDGGNIEGSTAYHRLTSEMVFYATSLIIGLPEKRKECLLQYNYLILRREDGKPRLKPAPLPFYRLPENSNAPAGMSPFPSWYFERMERMAELLRDVTKQDDTFVQIGDNDSGRLFKLQPRFIKIATENTYCNIEQSINENYYAEQQLDCRYLVAMAAELFGRDDLLQWVGGRETTARMPDILVMKALLSDLTVGSQLTGRINKESSAFLAAGTILAFQKVFYDNIATFTPPQMLTYTFRAMYPCDIRDDLRLRSYPDFGLYLFHSNRLFLTVRCFTGRQPERTGHMHEDQLSIELMLDGKNVIRDPGTYVYTPDPEERWIYRDVRSHFSPYCYKDGNASFARPVFGTLETHPAQVEYFGPFGFIARSMTSVPQVSLIIELKSDCIVVHHMNCVMPNPGSSVYAAPDYSPGYGIKVKSDLCTRVSGECVSKPA